MGLASEIGYEIGPGNGFRKAVAALGSTRPVSTLSNKLLRPLDRGVLRLSRGRTTVTSWLVGIPPLWLTTTGARSGMPRTVPLFGIPSAGELGLLGTSFGQRETPHWVRNLEAHPEALVSYRGAEAAVRARPAESEEASAIWLEAAQIYRGYANYRDWAAHRTIRVFVLELDESGSASTEVGSS
jgi:deazaflavin-dependent oxidoreductase (nitroreductase family)